jgi:hypothetical protein
LLLVYGPQRPPPPPPGFILGVKRGVLAYVLLAAGALHSLRMKVKKETTLLVGHVVHTTSLSSVGGYFRWWEVTASKSSYGCLGTGQGRSLDTEVHTRMPRRYVGASADRGIRKVGHGFEVPVGWASVPQACLSVVVVPPPPGTDANPCVSYLPFPASW